MANTTGTRVPILTAPARSPHEIAIDIPGREPLRLTLEDPGDGTPPFLVIRGISSIEMRPIVSNVVALRVIPGWEG